MPPRDPKLIGSTKPPALTWRDLFDEARRLAEGSVPSRILSCTMTRPYRQPFTYGPDAPPFEAFSRTHRYFMADPAVPRIDFELHNGYIKQLAPPKPVKAPKAPRAKKAAEPKAPRDSGLIGSLRPRGPGKWQSQIRQPGTKRTVSETWHVATHAEAKRLHAQWVADVIGHRVGPAGPPLAEHLDQWVRHARLNEGTELAYRDSIRRIVLHTDLGGVKLRDLTPRRLAVALGSLADQFAPSTVRGCRVVLRQALQLAVEWGDLPTNPMIGLRVNTRRDLQTKTVAATTEQIQAMIRRETDPLWRTFWLMLAATGCRQGELCALRWSDIDLEAGQITVARTMTRNLRSEMVVGTTTKTKQSRVIPIRPDAVAVLRQWRQHLAGLDLRLAAADGLVWAGIKKHHVLHHWHKTAELAGIIDPITPHSVRHWYATSLIRAGEIPAVVAAIMGHSIAETVNRYSDHLTPTATRQAIRKLPDVGVGLP